MHRLPTKRMPLIEAELLFGQAPSKHRRPSITEDEFQPPRPLTLVARQVWDRHAKRIHAEGRFQLVDHDQLCTYAETLELYLRFKKDIDDHGTLVQGRTLQEKVRNPSLMGLAQARADLIRLSKVIPLVNTKPDLSGAALDSWLDDLMADE
jgi:phage terminase small subunit